MLEAKVYKAIIVGSFLGKSAEKKTPYYGLEFETSCGEFVEWVAYLTDNTSKRNLETLKNVGFMGKKLTDLSNDKLSMDDLFNHNPELTITIEHEEYANKEGEIKTKAVVKWVNVGSFGAAKYDHAQALQEFAGNKYDGMLMSLLGDVNKSKKVEEKVTEEDDEDSPF